MMSKIRPKRSYAANAIPTTAELDVNELAINWTDGKAFTKNAAGSIVTITLGGSGGGDDARWDYFKPAAPTSVTAVAGNAQAVVSWTAPAIVVPPVTDYVVQFSSNSGSTWTTFSDGTSTATSATVTSLTNSSAYTFRVAAVNGIGTGAFSTASAAVTPVAGDPLFTSVALLLPMDGTGNTFVDSSATPKTITAFGNATQSATESKWGGKSAYFDGTGDYISIADSGDAFNFGTGDFCYEFWFLSSGSNAYATFIQRPWNGSGGFNVFANAAATGQPEVWWREANGGTSPFFASDTGGYNDNNWHHLVFNRSGTTCRLFIDGVIRATTTSSTSVASSEVVVGDDTTFAGRALVGYIDDLRITKGHARYTANFTPPTAAFPTS